MFDHWEYLKSKLFSEIQRLLCFKQFFGCDVIRLQNLEPEWLRISAYHTTLVKTLVNYSLLEDFSFVDLKFTPI